VGPARLRGVPRARRRAARHDRTGLQPSVDLQLGAVQRNLGSRDEGQRSRSVLARDRAPGRARLPARQIARSHAARRGQLGVLRQRPHRDRPQHLARLLARLALGVTRPTGERQHVPGVDVEFQNRVAPGRSTDVQLGVRQRVGLRGQYRRRRLELGLPPRHQRVSASPEDLRLALHRAPRRDQRVERLLATARGRNPGLATSCPGCRCGICTRHSISRSAIPS